MCRRNVSAVSGASLPVTWAACRLRRLARSNRPASVQDLSFGAKGAALIQELIGDLLCVSVETIVRHLVRVTVWASSLAILEPNTPLSTATPKNRSKKENAWILNNSSLASESNLMSGNLSG